MTTFLKNKPNWTIPPYQDNNNRRPPRCQSFIINSQYLDEKYPNWQQWLQELKQDENIKDFLDNFEETLSSIKNGKGRVYFSHQGEKKYQDQRIRKDLDTRILQFIFDRIKAIDSFKLNEIYSYAKKWKQTQSSDKEKDEARKKLEEAIANSTLLNQFKTKANYQEDDLFSQSSFLHLVCKYYKLRRRAKDGRVFIHPKYKEKSYRGYEDTGHFDNENHLLTYCNHKTRQKKYQSLGDIAAVFQIKPNLLEEFIKGQTEDSLDEKLISWLKNFGGLKTSCEKAAKTQKKYRGELKNKLSLAIFRKEIEDLRKKSKKKNSLNDEELKKLNKYEKIETPNNDETELINLDKSIKELSLKIAKKIFNNEKDLRLNKFNSIFSFAQIDNIAFKDRSGNSNTCPVCSSDNAKRMETVEWTNEFKVNVISAKAQRLPAISTRLIDGAVMRMARIVGKAIANEKWQTIENELKNNKLSIPIITEANSFDFEPNLRDLKGKLRSKEDKKPQVSSKDARIKLASPVCPYTGQDIKGNSEIDHIIPRSSSYGILNDEANLIYASNEGNQAKGERQYYLKKLNDSYKLKIFNTSDKEKIKEWILDKIWDLEKGEIYFKESQTSRYQSFINLKDDEQIALRHSLFLNHPIRKEAIALINNRNRTYVNGTQRYFAQVLANEIYKKAKKQGLEQKLSFDYFEVDAKFVSEVRRVYCQYEAYAEFKKDKIQKPFSHCIDAFIAFVIGSVWHQNEGSLKLDLGEAEFLHSQKFKDELFRLEKNFEEKELKRRKTYTVETHHRELIEQGNKKNIKINYQIHRDGIIKESFFPLLKLQDGSIRKGFTLSNSVDFKKSHFDLLIKYKFIDKSSENINYETWNIYKVLCQQFLMTIGEKVVSKEEIQVAKIIDNISYYTIKKPIEKVLDITPLKNKPPETIGDALLIWEKCITKEKFVKEKVILPYYNVWENFKKLLEKENKDKKFSEFLQKCKMFENKQEPNRHTKVKKVFSLPVQSSIGSIRLKRKSWDNKSTIQIVAEKSLAKYGLDGKGIPHTILSKNSIPIKHYLGVPNKLSIEPLKWYKIVPSYFEKDSSVIEAYVIYKDSKRCLVKLKVRNLENLSLPTEKSSWEGKVLIYDEEIKYKKAIEKSDGNYHYLLDEFNWFESFKLPKYRREVILKKNNDDSYHLEFTISKNLSSIPHY